MLAHNFALRMLWLRKAPAAQARHLHRTSPILRIICIACITVAAAALPWLHVALPDLHPSLRRASCAVRQNHLYFAHASHSAPLSLTQVRGRWLLS